MRFHRNTTLRARLNLIARACQTETTPDDAALVHEEHKMIYTAMRRGWTDAAEKLLRRHIANARRKYQVLAKP